MLVGINSFFCLEVPIQNATILVTSTKKYKQGENNSSAYFIYMLDKKDFDYLAITIPVIPTIYYLLKV